jgi:hypothetical protein
VIPVDQTVLDHGQDGGRLGDCLRACLATLLELPSKYVPHVVEHPEWWMCARFAVLDLTDGAKDLICVEDRAQIVMPVPVIASGPSPRGDWLHAVIVDSATGALLHDPHPSRAGLAGEPQDYIVLVDAWEADVAQGPPSYERVAS